MKSRFEKLIKPSLVLVVVSLSFFYVQEAYRRYLGTDLGAPTAHTNIVFGRSTAEARTKEELLLAYPESAVVSANGDVFIANAWGFSVERVRGRSVKKILGIRDDGRGLLNFYTDLQVAEDGDLWVVDSGAGEILKVDSDSGEIKRKIPAPTPDPKYGGDFSYISSMHEENGQFLIAAMDMKRHSHSTFVGVGSSAIFQLIDGVWVKILSAPEAVGQSDATFRDAMWMSDGSIAALAGNYFLKITSARTELKVDIGVEYGGGIFELKDGWLVGAYTQILKIDQRGGIHQSSFDRPLGNVGDIQLAGQGLALLTDTDRQTVYLFEYASGKILDQFGNSAQAMKVVALASRGPDLIMLDNSTPRVIEGNLRSGRKWCVAGTGHQGPSRPRRAPYFSLHYPSGMTIDKDGAIYVSEANYRIVRIRNGGVEIFAGDVHAGKPSENQFRTQARFGGLRGLSIDEDKNLYVADQGNHTVWKIDREGKVTSVIGNGVAGLSKEGEIASTQPLNTPSGVLARRDGTVLVADSYNNTIVEVGRDGRVRRFAGRPIARVYQGFGGYSGDNGAARDAELNTPRSLSEDEFGNVYIVDEFNNAIRKVSEGLISTFAGGQLGPSEDGSKMNLPQASTVFGDFLYVADTGNSAVRAFPLRKH